MLGGVGRPVAGRLGQLPAVLALDRAEQAAQIGLRPHAGFLPRKAGPEARRDARHLVGRRPQRPQRLHRRRPPAQTAHGDRSQHGRLA